MGEFGAWSRFWIDAAVLLMELLMLYEPLLRVVAEVFESGDVGFGGLF